MFLLYELVCSLIYCVSTFLNFNVNKELYFVYIGLKLILNSLIITYSLKCCRQFTKGLFLKKSISHNLIVIYFEFSIQIIILEAEIIITYFTQHSNDTSMSNLVFLIVDTCWALFMITIVILIIKLVKINDNEFK
jgi:hypothetical protein